MSWAEERAFAASPIALEWARTNARLILMSELFEWSKRLRRPAVLNMLRVTPLLIQEEWRAECRGGYLLEPKT